MATSLILIPASAGLIPSSSGCAAKYSQETNFPVMFLDFEGADDTADTEAYFLAVMPEVYTDGGDVEVRLYWEPETGAVASENVSWDISLLGRVDDEVLDAAFSDTQTVNDPVTAAGDLQVASATFTTPSLAAGDLLLIKVNRDYDEANGGTASGEHAYLHAIQVLEA